MIRKPLDVLEQFPIRKSQKQKRAFRNEAMDYAQKLGYPVEMEPGSFGAENIVMGDPENADYLVTAHYDTPASIGIPNFVTPCNIWVFLLYQILIVGGLLAISIGVAWLVGTLSGNGRIGLISWYVVYFGTLILMMVGPANRHNANDNTSGVVSVLEMMGSLPEEQRKKVCFVLFDLEEAGLIGSAAYRKQHKKATNRQLVINLDCIGDGDELVMFPVGKLKKQQARMAALEAICGDYGHKKLCIRKKGFAYCPSDHKQFPNAVGIMAFHRKPRVGLYCGRIHTYRDTILEEENVNIIRSALMKLICQ